MSEPLDRRVDELEVAVRKALDASESARDYDEEYAALSELAAIARDGQEALRRSALSYHNAQSHPRSFEICTWPQCRMARAALVSVPAGQETERCSASCPANTCFEIHGPHRCSLEGGHGGGHSFWCQRFEPSR